jgi:hypothetical protein
MSTDICQEPREHRRRELIWRPLRPCAHPPCAAPSPPAPDTVTARPPRTHPWSPASRSAAQARGTSEPYSRSRTRCGVAARPAGGRRLVTAGVTVGAPGPPARARCPPARPPVGPSRGSGGRACAAAPVRVGPLDPSWSEPAPAEIRPGRAPRVSVVGGEAAAFPYTRLRTHTARHTFHVSFGKRIGTWHVRACVRACACARKSPVSVRRKCGGSSPPHSPVG